MPPTPAPAGAGRALLSNSSALLSGRLTVAALGWAGTVLVVRTLTVDEWGRFSFIFSFLALVSVLTDLGIGRVVLSGLVGENVDRRAFAGTYVVLRAGLGVLGYLAAVAFVAVAGYPSEVVVGTAIAGFVIVVATPSNALNTIYQASMKMRTVAVAQVLGQTAQLALTAALAVADATLLWFVVPAVVFELVAAVHKVRRLPEDLRPVYGVDVRVWKGLLGEAAALSLGGILATSFTRIDMVMLSKLDSFHAVGVYGIGYKFADVVHAASTAVMASVLPLLVRAWPDRPDRFRRSLEHASSLLALLAVAVLVEFLLFAEPVIRLLYGSRYEVGGPAARMVVAAECVHLFGALAFTTLVATGNHRRYPIATFVGLAINVGLNLWLIPDHSYGGAAFATLVTELVVGVLLGWWAFRLRGVDRVPVDWPTAGAVLVAALLGTAAGHLLRQVAPWPVAAVAAGLVILGATHLLLRRRGGLAGLVRDEPEPDAGADPSADPEPVEPEPVEPEPAPSGDEGGQRDGRPPG